MDTGARTGGKSDLEEETSMNAGNKNNSIPNGDGEGKSDVEEAIKSISIMAGGTGRGSKQTTDKVMRLFINAHLLRGRKHCRRFHSNHYYRTTDIRELFILDSRFCFANLSRLCLQLSLHHVALVAHLGSHRFAATFVIRTLYVP